MDYESDQIRAHAVRLFPTVRISSPREAELRATASLLAMIRAVSEFGRAFVKAAGGPAGSISCFTEVPLREEHPSGTTEFRPDGIVRVQRGRTDWSALVEVKVGDNPLDQRQFDEYHRVARERGFNAFVTVSNQSALPDGLPPLAIDRRRLRGIPVAHLSWDRLVSEARMLSTRQGVSDTDQQWMLEEWIRYVACPEAKIIESPHLGEHWGTVIQAAREANLASVPIQLEDVVSRWDSFLKKAALQLRAKLGVEVRLRFRRVDTKDPDARRKRQLERAFQESRLSGMLRIPDAVGDVRIDVGLHARTVRFGVEVDPPDEGRQLTRLNWLVRQLRSLRDPPANLVIKVDWDQRRLQSSGKLEKILEDPTRLQYCGTELAPKDAWPRKYVLEWTTSLAKGRGRSSAPVLEDMGTKLERFYRDVVQHLVVPVRRAPQMLDQDDDDGLVDDRPRTPEFQQVENVMLLEPILPEPGSFQAEPPMLPLHDEDSETSPQGDEKDTELDPQRERVRDEFDAR